MDQIDAIEIPCSSRVQHRRIYSQAKPRHRTASRCRFLTRGNEKKTENSQAANHGRENNIGGIMWIEICSPAPILNTPNFSSVFGGENGSEIPLNPKGQPHHFEFVALEGMAFQVEEMIPTHNATIYRVLCPFYSRSSALYLDSRFAKPGTNVIPQTLPPSKIIITKMTALLGSPYVWGGNWSAGIPEMLSYYPAKGPINDRTRTLWTLRGVDCSGLLFEASHGATPRNTAQLLHFGTPVEIGAKLKSLDMILCPGHVVFILDEKRTIEKNFRLGSFKETLQHDSGNFPAKENRSICGPQS